MVARVSKAAAIPRHVSPHSLRHAAITNALDAGAPLRDAQILERHDDPRTTEHYDRARGILDRHRVHLLTAYVAGISLAKIRRAGSAHTVFGATPKRSTIDLLATCWKQKGLGRRMLTDRQLDSECPTRWATVRRTASAFAH